MIAWYKFDDEKNIGVDSSGNGFDAVPAGDNAPVIKDVDGRKAVVISGDGKVANSYIKLPENILKGVSDDDGLCISFWMNLSKGENVWERLFDFGYSPMPGKILGVKASVGQAVKKGDVVVVLEAMKMENEIVAPQDGTIASINVAVGDSVDSGAVLATLN